MPHGGGYDDLSSKINKLNQYDFIKNPKRGAILIECAFAVPVLFSLIYYIQDLSRYKQIQQRTQFVAQEIASILQNIGSQRAIVQKDLDLALQSAYLSVFPGKTMYPTSANHYPFGYFPHLWVYYVVGEGNKATVKWHCTAWSPSPGESRHDVSTNSQHPESTIKFVSGGDASSIYPDLKISDGEVKIIVECTLWYNSTRFFSETNVSCGEVPAKKAFGFYVLSPTARGIKVKSSYFTGVTIFSPVPKAFKDTPPELE